MLDALEPIIRLTESFTWKNILRLTFLLSLSIIGIAIYEGYTNSFELSRLKNSIEILESLKELETAGIKDSHDLNPMYDVLVSDFDDMMNREQLRFNISTIIWDTPSNHEWLKVIAMFVTWNIFVILIYFVSSRRSKKKEPIDKFEILINIIFTQLIALFFSGFSLSLTSRLWPWTGMVFYPLCSILIFIAIISLAIWIGGLISRSG